MAVVSVLACGERLRGDDGAAVLAVERLPEDVRALADVHEVGQLEVEALLDVATDEAVVVADAAVGVPAGRIVVRSLEEVAAGGALGGAGMPASSHALPPDQVLALAKELRGALPRGVFVGIGGAEFGYGEGLSRAVEAALPEFGDEIAAAIRRLSREVTPP